MSVLAGKLRKETGKSATQKLRNEEAMPAVMYGLKDNLSMVVNPKELKKLLEEFGRNALIELNIEGDSTSNRNVVLKEARLPLSNKEMIQLGQEINRIKVISCIFFQIYCITSSFEKKT